MFAIHQFPFISQCLRGHFHEVWTRAMRVVANCDAVCDIHFGDNVDYHSIVWIWNGNDTNHIMTVHESNAISFVFMICSRCCWIMTHCLSKLECRVDIQVQWHTKMRANDRKGWYCWKPSTRGQCLPLLWLKFGVLQCQHLLSWKLTHIFTGQVLGTVDQSNTYFFLLPLAQRLMSSGQNQNSYSTLLVDRNCFLSPLYVGAGVSYLLLPTLALHIVLVMAYNAQHCLAELGGNLQIAYYNMQWSILYSVDYHIHGKPLSSSLLNIWHSQI
jgi:hypothetical protein